MSLHNDQFDSDAIAALRKRVRLTQAQFAQKLMVTRMTVYRWESGKATPGAVYQRQMKTLWGFAMTGSRK